MRTLCLTYILVIMLIINFFKSTGVFHEEINYGINYIFMEFFGTASSLIVDKELDK